MPMRISDYIFLRDGNTVAPSSGAIIRLQATDLASHIDSSRLHKWIGSFPRTLRVSLEEPSEELGQVFSKLVFALTEHARLDNRPERLLHQSTDNMQLWLPVDDPLAAKIAAKLAEHILSYLQEDKVPDAVTAKLWHALRSRFWNQTHAHLARAAQQMGVPFYRLDQSGQQILQLGQGSRLRLCRETLTDQTPLFAQAATNKQALHALLQHRGVPLPVQQAVESLEQALAAAESISWPVVLKPANGGKGKGVWVGLAGPEAVRQAWQANAAGGLGVQLVQQTLAGADHRLLVVNGTLMAVAQRQPASLCCDGKHSLREQIEVLNADPERGVGYERLLNRVPVDGRLTMLLAEQGFTLNSVPPAGTRVQLSRTANLSQGGTAIDCSDHVHPDNRRLAEDIARLIGTDVVGLDLISSNIGVSWREGGTWLLEANLSPGLRPHLVANPRSDLCQRIVRQWMGDGPRAGRIPTALITGSIGKTTTSRMLAHILQTSGLRVGHTSSTGMELDGQVIAEGDLAGGGPALHLLQDRRVEAMVAEIARGGLLKAGLGITSNDVSAILNIRDNHIGSEGICSREDLAKIKDLVAKAAKDYLVVNADDPLVMAMTRDRPENRLALVSAYPDSVQWKSHKLAGYIATKYRMARDSRISLYHQGEEIAAIKLHDIPAAEQGAVLAIAPAAAFSMAMAYCLGVRPDAIIRGLRTFGTHESHTRGRFELFIDDPYRIIITKAGSPEAMETLSIYAQTAQPAPRGKRILFCVEGDPQPDEILRDIGKAAWGFEHIICASRDKRLGRKSANEVPRLLAEGASKISHKAPITHEAGTESEALHVLANLLEPGDLCLISNFNGLNMKGKLRGALLQQDNLRNTD